MYWKIKFLVKDDPKVTDSVTEDKMRKGFRITSVSPAKFVFLPHVMENLTGEAFRLIKSNFSHR